MFVAGICSYSLVGATCGSLVCFTLPALVYLFSTKLCRFRTHAAVGTEQPPAKYGTSGNNDGRPALSAVRTPAMHTNDSLYVTVAAIFVLFFGLVTTTTAIYAVFAG